MVGRFASVQLRRHASAGRLPIDLRGIKSSLLVVGPGRKRSPNWDAAWRLSLVDNLEVLVRQLWRADITEIFIGGSFAEGKEHPNDIDGYFVCDLMEYVSGALERKLNRLDPHGIWTWNRAGRRACEDFAHLQLPMWHQYRIELYPHTPGACSGLKDRHGNDMEFPAAFRQSRRNKKQRGIVKVAR
jgi:hypothetical protein